MLNLKRKVHINIWCWLAEEHSMPHQTLWETQFSSDPEFGHYFLENLVLSLNHSKSQQIPLELCMAISLRSFSLKSIKNGYWIQYNLLQSIFDIKYLRNWVFGTQKWPIIIFATKVLQLFFSIIIKLFILSFEVIIFQFFPWRDNLRSFNFSKMSGINKVRKAIFCSVGNILISSFNNNNLLKLWPPGNHLTSACNDKFVLWESVYFRDFKIRGC